MRDWRHVVRIADIERQINPPMVIDAPNVERTPEVEAWLEETNRRMGQQLRDAAMYGTGTFEAPPTFNGIPMRVTDHIEFTAE